MSKPAKPSGRWEALRPDGLEAIIKTAPVVYWPLGLLEHHGWHLPVGFDDARTATTEERVTSFLDGASR